MTEYRYSWKRFGTLWQQTPKAPCPKCKTESFTTIIDRRPRSLIPLTLNEYRKTVECLNCEYQKKEEILSEKDFNQLANEEGIPI